MASQWREIAELFSRRQARYGTLAGVSVLVVLGILVAVNYIGKRQNKRWDLTANKQFSLSDQSRNVLAKLDAPLADHGASRRTPEFQRFRDRLQEYAVRVEAGQAGVHRPRQEARRSPSRTRCSSTARSSSTTRGAPSASRRDTEQDITNAHHQGGQRPAAEGLLHAGPRREGHGLDRARRLQRDRRGARSARTTPSRSSSSRSRARCPTMRPSSSSPGPQIDFFPPEIEALKKYLAKARQAAAELDPPGRPTAAARQPDRARARLGHRRRQQRRRRPAGWASCSAHRRAVPVAANYPAHPITERFNVMTAYPLARSVTPVSGGVNGHTAQTDRRDQPAELGRSRPEGAAATGKVVARRDGRRQDGPDLDRRGGVGAGRRRQADAGRRPTANATRRSRRRASSCSATPTSRRTRCLGIQGNRDLFMNTVGWLSQQENLISIRPKEAERPPADADGGAAEQHHLAVAAGRPGWRSSATGVYSWWRRR